MRSFLTSLLFLLGSLLPAVLGLPAVIVSGGNTVAIEPRNNVNLLLAFISELFPVNIVIQDVGDLTEGAEKVFADLAGFDTSENDLVSGKCGDVVVIFARGTDEPGNVGALVGPPFFDALRAKLTAKGKSLAVQGVNNYAASVTGFLEGGDALGSQSMANLVKQAQKQCPASKIVMSGYSQGGQVVHKAAALLPAATVKALSSIVIFGDPLKGVPIAGAVASNVLTVCHTGDGICAATDFIYLPHLTYLVDAVTAASFVTARL